MPQDCVLARKSVGGRPKLLQRGGSLRGTYNLSTFFKERRRSQGSFAPHSHHSITTRCPS
eukprot:scaffold123634_cov32-Tisochrysis_lutea.AAC.1